MENYHHTFKLKTNKNYYSSDYKNNNKKKLKVLYYITLNENNIINWITKNNFVLRIDQNNNLISKYN